MGWNCNSPTTLVLKLKKSIVYERKALRKVSSLVPRTVCNDVPFCLLLAYSANGASTRAWIDAFFFLASAMLPPNQRMVLSIKHIVPATTIRPSSLPTLSGFVDYTAIVASQRVVGKSALTYFHPPSSLFPAAVLLRSPQFHVPRSHMPSDFFVMEAQLSDSSDHVLRQYVRCMHAESFFSK